MSLFNPWVLLGIVLFGVTTFFSGYKVRGDAEKAKQLEQAIAYAELVRDEQDRSAKIAADAERDLAKVRIRAKQREVGLREELTNATYRTCILPDSGRVLYNAAVRDARFAATGQPVESVRDAGTPATAGNDGRPAAGGNK